MLGTERSAFRARRYATAAAVSDAVEAKRRIGARAGADRHGCDAPGLDHDDHLEGQRPTRGVSVAHPHRSRQRPQRARASRDQGRRTGSWSTRARTALRFPPARESQRRGRPATRRRLRGGASSEHYTASLCVVPTLWPSGDIAERWPSRRHSRHLFGSGVETINRLIPRSLVCGARDAVPQLRLRRRLRRRAERGQARRGPRHRRGRRSLPLRGRRSRRPQGCSPTTLAQCRSRIRTRGRAAARRSGRRVSHRHGHAKGIRSGVGCRLQRASLPNRSSHPREEQPVRVRDSAPTASASQPRRS